MSYDDADDDYTKSEPKAIKRVSVRRLAGTNIFTGGIEETVMSVGKEPMEPNKRVPTS